MESVDAEYIIGASRALSRQRTRRVLGIRVDDVTLPETMATIADAATTGVPCHVITLNPEYVMRAPRWMRECGPEWMYRLVRQPSRFPRIVRVRQFGALAVLSTLAGRLRREKA